MTKRDLAWRLVGVLALAGAAGSSLLHRDVLTAHAHGPASSLELALGLTSFLLISLGILLVLRGARLRDGWIRDSEGAVQEQAEPRVEPIPQEDQDRFNAIVADPCALGGGRAAVAMFLADRAIRAAAASRDRPLRNYSEADKAGRIS